MPALLAACGNDYTSSEGTTALLQDMTADGALERSVAEMAARSALEDPRLTSMIEGNAERIAVTSTDGGLMVDVELTEPVPDEAYPLDMCSRPREDPVIGVRWLLSDDGREIRAVSPVWSGTISCI